jgi:hypothetical protein
MLLPRHNSYDPQKPLTDNANAPFGFRSTHVHMQICSFEKLRLSRKVTRDPIFVSASKTMFKHAILIILFYDICG